MKNPTADGTTGSAYPIGMTTNLTATPIERDVVIISGEDAPEYVQTQITQDVMSLPRGRSRWSYVLTPKSEIEAIVRVTKTLDGLVLDAAHGHGDRVRKRLDGPLFRMDVSFTQGTWPGIAWRGEGADEVEGDATILAALPWDGVNAVDEVGPHVRPPPDIAPLTLDELEAVRIAAAWPSEPEIGEKVTPAMTGIVGDTVSFDKGCYTGQEFVARVHHRDAVPPRRLVTVAFDPGSGVLVGADIEADGEIVGVLTSVSITAGIALGYCKRSISAGGHVQIGRVAASIG